MRGKCIEVLYCRVVRSDFHARVRNASVTRKEMAKQSEVIR